jgi:hypothetical protein
MSQNNLIFPYLQVAPNAINASTWTIADASGRAVDSGCIADWDPFMDLHCARSISINIGQAYRDTGLSMKAKLLLTAGWISDKAFTENCHSKMTVSYSDETQTFPVSFPVPGKQVAGKVRLYSRLVLLENKKPETILSPTLPGSILWEDDHEVLIEGVGARFPMIIVDFSEVGHPPEAGWLLFPGPMEDLSRNFLGQVELRINKTHKTVLEAVTSRDPDPFMQAVREVIRYSVTKELIEAAFRGEDAELLSAAPNYEEDSLGHVILGIIRSWMPGFAGDVRALKDMMETDPQRFDCELRAGMRLFGGRS